jgi:hypothetical protein
MMCDWDPTTACTSEKWKTLASGDWAGKDGILYFFNEYIAATHYMRRFPLMKLKLAFAFMGWS